MDWTELAQDRDKRQGVMNAATNRGDGNCVTAYQIIRPARWKYTDHRNTYWYCFDLRHMFRLFLPSSGMPLNTTVRSSVLVGLHKYFDHSAGKGKGNVIPLQAWTGPEGSRRLRLPDFKTIGTRRWLRLSAVGTGRLYPSQEIFLVAIYVRN